MSEKVTVFVTKYALTRGVFSFEAYHSSSQGSVYGASKDTQNTYYRIGTDCFLSVEEAEQRAEQIRDARIRLLEKKLAQQQPVYKELAMRKELEKLKTLTFF